MLSRWLFPWVCNPRSLVRTALTEQGPTCWRFLNYIEGIAFVFFALLYCLTDLASPPQISYPSAQALPLELAFGIGTINPELFGVDDRGFNP